MRSSTQQLVVLGAPRACGGSSCCRHDDFLAPLRFPRTTRSRRLLCGVRCTAQAPLAARRERPAGPRRR